MSDEERRENLESPPDLPADRESPVGAPVVRGDRSVTGERAEDAVAFDPDDPESVARAIETVRELATTDSHADNVYVLRSAAAAAALVRGEGSYRGAAERVGEPVSVPFIRKWARVHDLPEAIRRQVATGAIAPSAAKHVARVGGTDRYLLAWAIVDADLTVREVRRVASEVNDGSSISEALETIGVDLGTIGVTLPPDVYLELRRRASLEGVDPGRIVSRALERQFSDADR
jgi:hypothetical protein